MLGLDFIRAERAAVEKALKVKGVDLSLDDLLSAEGSHSGDRALWYLGSLIGHPGQIRIVDHLACVHGTRADANQIDCRRGRAQEIHLAVR